MGLTQSLTSPFKRIQDYSLEDASALRIRYRDSDLDFGINASELATLLESKDIEEAKRMIFAFTDKTIISIVNLIGGAIACCNGEQSAKIEELFDVIDFDQNGKISRDELACLMIATQSGISKMTGKGKIKTNAECEEFLTSAFKAVPSDGDGLMTKAPFATWLGGLIGDNATIVGVQKVRSNSHSKGGRVLFDVFRKVGVRWRGMRGLS